MDSVTVRWSVNRQFVGWDADGHGVVMDTRPDKGGESSGVRPLELILYGLAGCTGMDVISILEKKRQRVTGMQMNVVAEQRDDFPKIYTRIGIEFVVTGDDVDPRAVERAIELSEEKYCAVKGMLGSETAVSTSYRIEQAS